MARVPDAGAILPVAGSTDLTADRNDRVRARDRWPRTLQDVVDLGGRCSLFLADVDVDPEVGAAGSVVFEVW